MQNKNQQIVFKKNTLCHRALEGEGGMKYRVSGKVNKASLICAPSSARWASSPSRGKETAHAFTLIELLVVVLIIGILAAVAVPQYRMAVEKSRATQVCTLLAAIYPAQNAYYLANGSFTKDLKELDVEFPYNDGGKNNLMFEGGGYSWGKGSDANSLYAKKSYNGGTYGFSIYYATNNTDYDEPVEAGEITCIADQDGKAVSICQSLGYTKLYATSSSQKLNYYKKS